MAELYWKGVGDVDRCAEEVEKMGQGAHSSSGPVVGVNIQVSLYQKVADQTDTRYQNARRAALSKMH